MFTKRLTGLLAEAMAGKYTIACAIVLHFIPFWFLAQSSAIWALSRSQHHFAFVVRVVNRRSFQCKH